MPDENFGNLRGGGPLHKDMMFGEVIANVMGNYRIYSAGVFFDRYNSFYVAVYWHSCASIVLWHIMSKLSNIFSQWIVQSNENKSNLPREVTGKWSMTKAKSKKCIIFCPWDKKIKFRMKYIKNLQKSARYLQTSRMSCLFLETKVAVNRAVGLS